MIKLTNYKNNEEHFFDEKGSALVYILIAIALLAALTVSFMEPSSKQTQSQNTFKTVSEIQSQVEFIRSTVQECVLTYSGGDVTIDNSGTGTDVSADRRYPIKPNSTHYTGATIGATAGRLVKDIRCPGNPGDDKNHVKIFGGSAGKFLPPPPKHFDDWQWYNGVDGIYFWVETTKTDAFLQTALSKLDNEFGDCESDTIDASAGAVNLDSDAVTSCSNGAYCFRLWMIVNSGTAVFPDEVGCP